MGRTSKLSPERQTAIENALRAGNTRRAAAAFAEIDPATFYRWLEADASFREAIEKAEADAETRFMAQVAKAATNGTWQAAAWWLERRRFGDFALRTRTELTGLEGGPIATRDVTADFDDAEKRALVRAVQHHLTVIEGGSGEAAPVAEGTAVADPREGEPATA